MGFSERQIAAIRDALGAYRLYTPGWNRRHLSWAELTSKIEVYADIELGKDLLRQFVEGVSRKDPGKRREPEASTLGAIVAFLTDPGIQALSRDEFEKLKGRMPSYNAPFLLLNYLKLDLDTEILKPPQSLNGSYEARWTMLDESPALVTLNLDCPDGGDLIAISETVVVYRADRPEPFDPVRDKPGQQKMRKHSRGWAILTPEDNLLAFMKEDPYGYNHYYLTLATESDIWSRPAAQRMTLLRHDYPLEYEKPDTAPAIAFASEVAEYARSKLLHFERIAAPHEPVRGT